VCYKIPEQISTQYLKAPILDYRLVVDHLDQVITANRRPKVHRVGSQFHVVDAVGGAAIPSVSVGVDLGTNRMAQVSNGSYFETPALTQAQSDQAQMPAPEGIQASQRKHQPQKGSATAIQAYSRVGNIRYNALHQETTSLAKSKSAVAMDRFG
jgi:hypothetical protein